MIIVLLTYCCVILLFIYWVHFIATYAIDTEDASVERVIIWRLCVFEFDDKNIYMREINYKDL